VRDFLYCAPLCTFSPMKSRSELLNYHLCCFVLKTVSSRNLGSTPTMRKPGPHLSAGGLCLITSKACGGYESHFSDTVCQLCLYSSCCLRSVAEDMGGCNYIAARQEGFTDTKGLNSKTRNLLRTYGIDDDRRPTRHYRCFTTSAHDSTKSVRFFVPALHLVH